jgi:hypothetical protein
MTDLMESAQRTSKLPLPSRMEDYFFKNGRTVLNEKRPPIYRIARSSPTSSARPSKEGWLCCQAAYHLTS